MSIKNSVKKKLSKYPFLYSCGWRVYHFLNFRKIARSKIEMYRRQLRLYRYFEVIYAYELEYLREHCRKLEMFGSGSPIKNSSLTVFPRVSFTGKWAEGPNLSGNSVYVKRYQTKNRWGGLSADQAFYLEVVSLRRLNAVRECNKFCHFPFPILIEASESDVTIKISHCGWSLDQLESVREKIRVENTKSQIENIVALLIKSEVMHLDLRPDGKNICVDPFGNLSLIDFDIVVINDERPLSWQIERRRDIVRKFPDGYYVWAVSKINRALQKHSDKLELL